MPANIETFVSHREVPWHRIGTITESAMTAREAASLAELNDWNVHKEVLTTESGLVIPDKYATVRNHPTKGASVLGVVGDRYHIVQNETAFETLDYIVDESGAHFETAGSLAGGKRVFMSMKMPDGVLVAGQDRHEVYLLATNSHDGSMAFTVAVTPVRVVCQNTLTIALQRAQQSFSIRHTESVQGRIHEAREALAITFSYMEEFEEELERMLGQSFSDESLDKFVKALVPDTQSEHEGWKKRVTDARQSIESLFRDAETNDFGRGTKYAALNAATEYADWYMPVAGNDETKRAERALLTPRVQNFKDKALALLG